MINKLHERSLRILLNNYSSGFNELLENNNAVCTHHRNIQIINRNFQNQKSTGTSNNGVNVKLESQYLEPKELSGVCNEQKNNCLVIQSENA